MTRRPEGRRGLVEAGIALTSELSLDAVLRKLVETAAELTGARYAALGVIDRTGTGLEQFVTTGLSDEAIEAIGDRPRGLGILAALIRDAKPLRLHDLAQDSRSVGFPPNHPPMQTFLGVPIALRGVAYGNLYLTEKADAEDFTEEDEELVVLLAAQAAVAIENARLYESATRWLKQLESLTEVSNALATELELKPLLELVARNLCELVSARLVTIVLPGPGDALTIEAAAGDRAADALGLQLGTLTSKSGRVLERRRTERVDSMLDDPEIDQEAARRLGLVSGLFVPLVARDKAIGVIACHDKLGRDSRFTDEDVRIAEVYASRAAVAADLSQRVARDALLRVVSAQELERKRLARELHDETGQALTSILLGLRSVEDAGSVDEARRAAADLRGLVVTTLQDVRRLAVELRPKALDDFGLEAALERLAETFGEQTGITVEVESRFGAARLPPELETAIYRIVQEALTNVVKHAGARSVSILLTRKNGAVAVLIEDDGRGFEPAAAAAGDGLGLLGMRERVALLGGRLTVESAEGAGTTVAVEVPLT